MGAGVHVVPVGLTAHRLLDIEVETPAAIGAELQAGAALGLGFGGLATGQAFGTAGRLGVRGQGQTRADEPGGDRHTNWTLTDHPDASLPCRTAGCPVS